MMTITEM